MLFVLDFSEQPLPSEVQLLEDCVPEMVISSVPGFHFNMLSQLYISLFKDLQYVFLRYKANAVRQYVCNKCITKLIILLFLFYISCTDESHTVRSRTLKTV